MQSLTARVASLDGRVTSSDPGLSVLSAWSAPCNSTPNEEIPVVEGSRTFLFRDLHSMAVSPYPCLHVPSEQKCLECTCWPGFPLPASRLTCLCLSYFHVDTLVLFGSRWPKGTLVAYLAEPRRCRLAPVSAGPRAVQSRPSRLARPSPSPTCHYSGDDFTKSFHCGDILSELTKDS